MRHEDDRRILVEWVENTPFKTAKIVTAKQDCVLGDHHHLQKDERFCLLSGKASRVIVGDYFGFNLVAPQVWDVPRGAYHLFDLEAGSVMLGVGSEPFDQSDEIPGKP